MFILGLCPFVYSIPQPTVSQNGNGFPDLLRKTRVLPKLETRVFEKEPYRDTIVRTFRC